LQVRQRPRNKNGKPNNKNGKPNSKNAQSGSKRKMIRKKQFHNKKTN